MIQDTHNVAAIKERKSLNKRNEKKNEKTHAENYGGKEM